MPEPDLALPYRGTRQRWPGCWQAWAAAPPAANVPACPRWSVRDVLAHLAVVAEDVVAGLLSGPPSDDETAVQVRRFDGRPVADVLAAWTAVAPWFEELIGAAGDGPPQPGSARRAWLAR
jgi:hypothetical protein